MSGGKRSGAGRKSIQIDLSQLEKLCGMGCTEQEIAAWFEISLRTLANRKKSVKFAAVMERGRAIGRISVRRAQIKLLEAGNATIAVWLGKSLLGQRDHVQLPGANGSPAETEPGPDYSQVSMEELRFVFEVLAKATGRKKV